MSSTYANDELLLLRLSVFDFKSVGLPFIYNIPLQCNGSYSTCTPSEELIALTRNEVLLPANSNNIINACLKGKLIDDMNNINNVRMLVIVNLILNIVLCPNFKFNLPQMLMECGINITV